MHSTTDDQDPGLRRAFTALAYILIGVGLIFALNIAHPAPAQPPAYQPEPQQITIDNSSEVHIMSDWCVGYCP